MNKLFLEHYVHTAPENTEQKYIFLTDDREIVDYLIQTVLFFMLGNSPYIYENGCYHEDNNGIQLKSKIQKLIFRDCIKATMIQSIYNLLVA